MNPIPATPSNRPHPAADLEDAGTDIALALNRAVPDHLAADAVACGLLTYLVALARTSSPSMRHRIAVMTTNAAAELAGVPRPSPLSPN